MMHFTDWIWCCLHHRCSVTAAVTIAAILSHCIVNLYVCVYVFTMIENNRMCVIFCSKYSKCLNLTDEILFHNQAKMVWFNSLDVFQATSILFWQDSPHRHQNKSESNFSEHSNLLTIFFYKRKNKWKPYMHDDMAFLYNYFQNK